MGDTVSGLGAAGPKEGETLTATMAVISRGPCVSKLRGTCKLHLQVWLLQGPPEAFPGPAGTSGFGIRFGRRPNIQG